MRAEGSTLEQIRFLEDVIKRVCEKEIESEVKLRTKKTSEVLDELKNKESRIKELEYLLAQEKANSNSSPLKEEFKNIFDIYCHKELKDFQETVGKLKKDFESLNFQWSVLPSKAKVLTNFLASQDNIAEESNNEKIKENEKKKRIEGDEPISKLNVGAPKLRSISTPKQRVEEVWLNLDESEINNVMWLERCKVKPFFK